MSELQLETRMLPVRGLAFKGTVVKLKEIRVTQHDGTEYHRAGVVMPVDVFIKFDTLWEVAERTASDAFIGAAPPFVGYHEELVLLHLGLAEKETRGGIHGTDKLRKLLGEENFE